MLDLLNTVRIASFRLLLSLSVENMQSGAEAAVKVCSYLE